MTPQTLGFTLVLGILIIVLPREYSPIPLLLGTCYVTLAPRIMIGPMDFTVFRILVTFGWLRVLIRREFECGGFNEIDKVFILWALCMIVTGTLLNSNMEGFINRLGKAYNAIGLYFLFRFLIRDISDITRIVKAMAIIFFPLTIAMLIEKFTGRNFFSIFGGVPEFSMIRNGRLRTQGPFAHPIMAGTAAATAIPFMLSLWWKDQKSKKYSIIGLSSCFIIPIITASSGPALAFIFSTIGMAMWYFRDNMKFIRRSLFCLIILLHFIMKAPVWFLIGRLGHLIGGTGFHRSLLIDRAIMHIDEWWICGTNYTRHWMPTGVSWSPDHSDITNYYIKMGVIGGLPLLILFITLIVHSFKGVGRALYATQNSPMNTRILIWALGAALFSHTLSFISVSYFDQIVVFWYLLLSMISTVSNLSEEAIEY